MKSYDHKEIEKKWRDIWEKDELYKTPNEVSNKKNFYCLVEFPYPSGNLHVGHWYAFSITDIYARYKRMQGFNVLFPIGFDAFGLPAENAAIKRGLNPREWTYDNIDYMKTQIKSMGTSFDWSRELATCDPEYYKWTQWFFTQFVKNDLAYQAETTVNWCPSCKTVLANEQVVDGHCDRCDSDVEHKKMNQWMIRATKYADRLLDDLETLEWPHAIKQAQREWIGKSEGANVVFKLKESEKEIVVYTTRVDTIFSGTFVILAPEHNLINELKEKISNWEEVESYIKEAQKKTDVSRMESKDKTGVQLKGLTAVNPATGEDIGVWITDFVLVQYGTGAVFADAHDERDFELAKKYDIPLKVSIVPENTDEEEVIGLEKCFSGEGILINSGQFDGLTSRDARTKITEWLKEKNLAEKTTNYKLRDWGVSRQRYWGCPIPIIHCKKCGAVPVPEKDLPVELPEIDDYLPRDDGKSPLSKAAEWVNVDCPECGEKAERETDTLDTFVDSSWYFLRYADPKNTERFADQNILANWSPVDFYSGGAEHTTMHLLYSRLFQKILFDLNLVAEKEPYARRMNRGLILGPDGNKMSKSKGNVIDPDEIVVRLGSDTVRSYLAFIGPYNEVGSYPWDPNGVVGVRRFLERMYGVVDKHIKDETPEEVDNLLHKTIKKVSEDMELFKFNTAISSLMILTNLIEKEGISKKDFGITVRLLSPIAPHTSEEIWHLLGNEESVHINEWPEYDEKKTIDESISIALQVNGKVRSEINISHEESESKIKEMALQDEKIQKWIGGKEVKKVIYVKGKLVSIVTS